MTTLTELLDLPETSSNNSNKLTTRGKLLLGLTGGIAVGLTIICTPFITPALRKFCLPYIPATPQQIENIVKALKGRKGCVVDLGSGDGRIVFELARHNYHMVHGVELNPCLVLYAKLQTLRYGLKKDRVRFYRHDLWTFDLHQYDNIVIFGVEQMMGDLETKFDKECKSDCSIIACRFPLPNKIPKKTIGCGVDTVWIYQQ